MWSYLNSFLISGNEAWRIAAFFGSVLCGLVGGRIVQFIVARGADRHKQAGRALRSVLLHSLERSMLPFCFALSFRIGLSILTLSPRFASLFTTSARVLVSLSVGYALYGLVDFVDYWLTNGARKTGSRVDDMLVPLVGRSIRVTIVTLVALQVAQTLSDKPITAIVASLGIGGLAVALAAQDTIKNFFGSLVIIGDKPFEIGDRIVVDGFDGPVEKVGFRSTRIRTLEGHLVTVPNGELVNKTVQNIGKRPHIRRVANITITYDTPPEKVAQAVAILKEVLHAHEGMHEDFPPRVFFSDFNECSLNLVMIYWYHPPDYWAYMAFSEWVNSEILKRFNAEGIEFAFPTQTLFLAGDEKRQLALRVIKDV